MIWGERNRVTTDGRSEFSWNETGKLAKGSREAQQSQSLEMVSWGDDPGWSWPSLQTRAHSD